MQPDDWHEQYLTFLGRRAQSAPRIGARGDASAIGATSSTSQQAEVLQRSGAPSVVNLTLGPLTEDLIPSRGEGLTDEKIRGATLGNATVSNARISPASDKILSPFDPTQSGFSEIGNIPNNIMTAQQDFSARFGPQSNATRTLIPTRGAGTPSPKAGAPAAEPKEAGTRRENPLRVLVSFFEDLF